MQQENSEIIYFSINNWFLGQHYPKSEQFIKWVNSEQFSDDKWCKENKLCVRKSVLDMSHNWCVTASRKWVEENCPELLTDDEYSYKIISCSSEGEVTTEHYAKFSDFLYKPNEDGTLPHDRFCIPFLEYKEENFGSTFYEYPDEDDDEDETEENSGEENSTDWTVPETEKCTSCPEDEQKQDEDFLLDEQKEEPLHTEPFFKKIKSFFKSFFCICNN